MKLIQLNSQAIFDPRRGSIIVLTAVLMVVIMAFCAFTVDYGFIVLTRANLQKTADASARAAVLELPEGFGVGASKTVSETEAAARQAAVDVAAANQAGGESSVFADGQRDVRLGQYTWDADGDQWVIIWDTPPYNMAQVTLHRDDVGSDNNGDGPLNLFFAPVIGNNDANVSAFSRAAALPGVGFKVDEGQHAPVLPITLDEPSWDDVVAGIGQDEFSYDPSTGQVVNYPDGVAEVNLYPYQTNSGNGDGDNKNSNSPTLPSGNRGMVDFGSSNNSTSDIARQILHGLNEYDLSFFGGELRFDEGPLYINGDTGISAGIKDELAQIIGETRAIPIFTEVSGNGNNAYYTIVRFVGVRILEVQLTGPPSQKRLMIQPAPLMDGTVIPGKVSITPGTILSRVSSIR